MNNKKEKRPFMEDGQPMPEYGFTMIDNAFMKVIKYIKTPAALKVYLFLRNAVNYTEHKDFDSYHSRYSIAEKLGMVPDTVTDATIELEWMGLVFIKRYSNHTNTYTTPLIVDVDQVIENINKISLKDYKKERADRIREIRKTTRLVPSKIDAPSYICVDPEREYANVKEG
jgi:hypothetical protein